MNFLAQSLYYNDGITRLRLWAVWGNTLCAGVCGWFSEVLRALGFEVIGDHTMGVSGMSLRELFMVTELGLRSCCSHLPNYLTKFLPSSWVIFINSLTGRHFSCINSIFFRSVQVYFIAGQLQLLQCLFLYENPEFHGDTI